MKYRSIVALFCLPAVCAIVARAADAPLGVPAEGEPFRASFVGADSTWNLKFSEGDKPREMPAAELVVWGRFVEPARNAFAVLAGGGLLALDKPRLDGEKLAAVSPTFGPMSLPIGAVSGIVFRPPLDPPARDKLVARILAPGGRGDRLILENGDELAGTITALDDSRLVLDKDGADVEVKIGTLVAALFDPALVDAPRVSGLRGVVGFRDGSRLTAVEIVGDSQQMRLKLPGGVDLKAPTASIAALQIFGGRAAYLSDLKPASYRHIPYLQLAWPYQADRSVLGSMLRAGGRLYIKGLGMHSPSRLTYDLDEPYRRFQADVAVDDEAQMRGSVVFRVFVDDGSGQWLSRAESEIIRGGQEPASLSVDLTGAKRISLLVDFADRGDEQDHADWLNARLVR